MRGPKLKNRLGETNTMKNGLSASIVRYKSSAEIDVQFEDGTIVRNRTYSSFQKGLIAHPDMLYKSKRKDRTGDVKLMSNGMNAKIIRYGNSKDIDVEFEDGEIRKGCTYKEFNSGNIAHPHFTSEFMANDRLGEKKTMKCGLDAEITKYVSYHDVEVTFEDGTIVYPVDYGQFTKGSIAHPNHDGGLSLQEASVAFYFQKLGFEKTKKGYLKEKGLGNYELDLFHPEKAIAVEVDGRFHKSQQAVERDMDKNLKCYNAGIKLYRIRDKGLPILTDDYSINYDLDGEYLYNGLVDCGNVLKKIMNENDLKPPTDDYIDFNRDLEIILEYYFEHSDNHNRNERVGEKIRHRTTNQWMTIIDYKDYQHITVQFEDGEVAQNKNYGAFRRGEIKHPKELPEEKKKSRIGATIMMNCGSSATIIEYRNAEDMDVQFDDGSVRKGVTFYNFSRGTIKKG